MKDEYSAVGMSDCEPATGRVTTELGDPSCTPGINGESGPRDIYASFCSCAGAARRAGTRYRGASEGGQLSLSGTISERVLPSVSHTGWSEGKLLTLAYSFEQVRRPVAFLFNTQKLNWESITVP